VEIDVGCITFRLEGEGEWKWKWKKLARASVWWGGLRFVFICRDWDWLDRLWQKRGLWVCLLTAPRPGDASRTHAFEGFTLIDDSLAYRVIHFRQQNRIE
jgi:hypothetical protein